ncbi:MAG TPA: AAA family ATPase [Nitrospirota bacterium]|nr:AAA family ATPase [Nitrospirota bacterium]
MLWATGRLLAAETAGKSGALLVLDEIQKVTGRSEVVKKLWDGDTQKKTPLKVVLLGSASLLIQRGLTESLAGRFETIPLTHWSYAEMQEAFGWDLDRFIYFGGYPGAAELVADRQRWPRYIIDSLIETTLSRDILLLTGRQTRAAQTAFPARMLAFEQDTLLSKDDRPAPGRRQHDDPGPLSGTARWRRHADRPAQVLRAEGPRAGLEPQVTGIEHGTHQRAKTGRPEAGSWNRPSALI